MSTKPRLWITLSTLAGVTLVGGWAMAQTQVDPLTGQPVAAPQPAAEQAAPPRADLSEANELVRAGDYAQAETVLSGLQEEFPEDGRLQLMHGEILLALSQPSRALPLLRKAAELDGQRPRVHFQLATALLGTDDKEGAISAFGREIELNEDGQVRLMAHLNRAMLMEDSKDWSGAADEMGAVLEIDPTKVEIFGELARLHLLAGSPQEASGALEQGLERGFRSAEHFLSLGAKYAERSAYNPAIKAYRRAIEIDPALADAQRSLAAALDETGKGDEALPHLQRYLELEPDAPDAERVSQRIRELAGG